MSFQGPLFRLLAQAEGDDEEHFGVHIAYSDLYQAILFLAAIYAGGVFCSRFLSMPALVGEIFTGILLGPNLANLVPIPEAFVLLGEIGLILLVVEAGIDIDLTMLRLIGGRGIAIALVGSILPMLIAFGIAYLLGYTGMAAIAAGCTFAPTSLGIAMNILRQSNIVNTPVGQLIVAAAIIDDMFALVILSQLQAFTSEVTAVGVLVPILSALGFLVIGGAVALFVLPNVLDRLVYQRVAKSNLGWVSLAIMFSLLLGLIPLTHACKASPLMGAFLAGLVFCSNAEAHHYFVNQFKRVMQWLLRIFFAASIGFQVPIQHFASAKVVLQGLLFTVALLGKVGVGFMVPNLSAECSKQHIRNCLVVGFSMAAEGEFAFVIAVFAVSNQLITQDLYAALVLAVLISTIASPFCLRATISHFNKLLETSIQEAQHDSEQALAKGIRQGHAVFLCIQTKSDTAWGLQLSIMQELDALNLSVIDHRSWHPRHSTDLLINEVYAQDNTIKEIAAGEADFETLVDSRITEISVGLEALFRQKHSLVKVQRWVPEIPARGLGNSDAAASQHIVRAAGEALENSRRKSQHKPPSPSKIRLLDEEEDNYVAMEEGGSSPIKPASSKESLSKHTIAVHRQISPLDKEFKGKLEGLFRKDNKRRSGGRIKTVVKSDGIELLDVHGVDTGFLEEDELSDYHGFNLEDDKSLS